MTQYFIIRDATDEGHIIAIHRVWDSANACFSTLIKNGNFTRYMEMVGVCTDQYGLTTKEILIYTYSKASEILVRHYVASEDVSGATVAAIHI